MSYESTFLFAQPSFFEGAARALDLGCTLDHYNSALSESQADAMAMYADWLAVGHDIQAAIAVVKKGEARRALKNPHGGK